MSYKWTQEQLKSAAEQLLRITKTNLCDEVFIGDLMCGEANPDRMNALELACQRNELLDEIKEAVELTKLTELPSWVTRERWERLIAKVESHD